MSIVDPLRLVVGWLTDVATGVNTQLPSVPRDAGVPAPPSVRIVNQLDDPWVARDVIPLEQFQDGTGALVPLLIVRHMPRDQGMPLPVLPMFVQENPAIAPLVLVYAARKIEGKASSPATTAQQVTDSLQTMRTCQRVVARKLDGPNTSFLRNQCEMSVPPEGLTLDPRLVEADGDAVLASLLVPIRVLDRWALGIV